MDPAKAQKITNMISLGYVLFGSTLAGFAFYLYRNSDAQGYVPVRQSHDACTLIVVVPFKNSVNSASTLHSK